MLFSFNSTYTIQFDHPDGDFSVGFQWDNFYSQFKQITPSYFTPIFKYFDLSNITTLILDTHTSDFNSHDLVLHDWWFSFPNLTTLKFVGHIRALSHMSLRAASNSFETIWDSLCFQTRDSSPPLPYLVYLSFDTNISTEWRAEEDGRGCIGLILDGLRTRKERGATCLDFLCIPIWVDTLDLPVCQVSNPEGYVEQGWVDDPIGFDSYGLYEDEEEEDQNEVQDEGTVDILEMQLLEDQLDGELDEDQQLFIHDIRLVANLVETFRFMLSDVNWPGVPKYGSM